MNAKRKMIIMVLIGLMMFVIMGVDKSYAATKMEIDASVNATLDRFDVQVKGAKEYRAVAKGILVIPNVTKAAFIIGGQYGQGALQVEEKPADYYSLVSGSLGYQIGVEKYDLVIIFATDEALRKFRESEGWEVGLNAEITFVEVGVDVPVSTLVSRNPVLGFVIDQKGLMAGISLKGAKFTKIKPD